MDVVTTRDLDELAGTWDQRLADLLADHDVPGACLGVLSVDPRTGERRHYRTAAGVLSRRTGLACTIDSLFQIGSVTKPWTATVIMLLADRGLLDLDRPLVAVLPDLRLRDGLEQRATVRQLLSHTSGLDGDVITDTGRGDDAVGRYVDLLAEAGINHPLGATFSYCNSGYVILGRIVEELTGGTWDAAIRTELAGPLDLEHVYTLPEECMVHRFAVGHVSEDDQPAHVAAEWGLPRSLGPAGLITCTVDDVLDFAALHLSEGRNGEGKQVLSPERTAAMQAPEVVLPDPYTLGESWGLGWVRFAWDGRTVIGHDGNTIGQDAYLRMVPDRGPAVVLLTNGGESADLFQVVITELLGTLTGIRVPPRVEPSGESGHGDVADYLGRYQRASRDTEVYLDGDRLMMRATVTGPLADYYEKPTTEHELHRITGTRFAFRDEGDRHWTPAVFYELPDGARYLHYSARANPRVGS
jgi:CubicO group peptidase (beta-lactamase class C family)